MKDIGKYIVLVTLVIGMIVGTCMGNAMCGGLCLAGLFFCLVSWF